EDVVGGHRLGAVVGGAGQGGRGDAVADLDGHGRLRWTVDVERPVEIGVADGPAKLRPPLRPPRPLPMIEAWTTSIPSRAGCWWPSPASATPASSMPSSWSAPTDPTTPWACASTGPRPAST